MLGYVHCVGSCSKITAIKWLPRKDSRGRGKLKVNSTVRSFETFLVNFKTKKDVVILIS